MRLHVLGLSDTTFPLPSAAGRSLVISPFVTNDFLMRANLAKVDALVSSPESLDLLDPAILEPIGSVWAFDDGSDPAGGPAEGDLSSQDPGRPLRGLHAKVFAFETGDRAQLFCGSANATGAAFARNVEVLVELTGPVSAIGIDQLCNGSGDEAGLWSLFHTYIPAEVPPETAPDGPVDGIRRRLGSLAIDGSVEESGEGWAVTYRTQAPLPHTPGITVACWPLSTSGNRRTVAAGDRLDARFEGALESISGFLAFEVAHQESGTITRFVVPVNLIGLPADRDRHLMRSLIGNAERFLRYLLALLDEDHDQMEMLDVIGRLSDDEPTAPGAFSLPVLEKLLRTMRRDPAKLVAIHPLVTDLAEDGALPPGFAELWATVHDVALGSSTR